MSRRKIYAADLFCGAGGTSQGLLMAANSIHADLELIAINHWQTAIDSHTVNHPEATNLCTGLAEVDPLKVVPGGRLHVLCASPECTHHSVARGGKPMDDQSRSSPMLILDWLNKLIIDNVIIENVPEFQGWGPLVGPANSRRPDARKKGHLFNAWIEMIRALNYRVEWRVLNCADYGAPTTRRRLFIICRRNGKKITWPEPTHVAPGVIDQSRLFAEKRPNWKTAREIIDWSRESKDIFDRKKPLSDNTLRRISAGMLKFNGIRIDLEKCIHEGLRPYLVVLRGTSTAASVDAPLHTVTAGGNHYGLVQPFLLPHRVKDGVHSIDEPTRTVTATSSDFALVQPFTLQIDHTSGTGSLRRADEPIPTLVTKENTAVIEPLLVQTDQTGSNGMCVRPVSEPSFTAVTNANLGVATAEFVLGQQSGSVPRSVDDPIPTVAAAGAVSLTQPFITPNFGEREKQEPRTHSVDSPSPTVTGRGAGNLVEPFVVPQFGTADPRDIDRPLGTVTTTSRGVGLIEPFLTTGGGATGQSRNPKSVDEPVGAVLTNDRRAVAEPFMVAMREGEGGRTTSVDRPLATVTAGGKIHALTEPFLATVNHGEGLERRVKSVDTPLATVTGSTGDAVCEPFIATVTHQGGDRIRSVDDPLATVTRSMGEGVAEPMLVEYYGNGRAQSVDEPVPTVVTKDRFALALPEWIKDGDLVFRLEIRFRMLQPMELARAQGFPDSYKFTGNREAVVKQIGNAVPPPMAAALCAEVLA